MKLQFKSYGNIQTATADGTKTYEYEANSIVDVPDEIAVLFINAGVAEQAKTTRATKPAGEKATK